MAKHVHSHVLVARLFLVALVAAASGWFLVVGFAFASVTGVSPSGSPQWWAGALDRLFFSSSESVISWLLSALLLACVGTGARDLGVLLYRIGAGLVAAFARSSYAPVPVPPMKGTVG